MPKGIGARGIGSRSGVALRSIASRYRVTTATQPLNYPPGSYTFTAARAGFWKFVLWGGGGGCANATGFSGASGGYCEITRYLRLNQTVALVVGAGGFASVNGQDTTATLPDGTLVTAGGGVKDGGAGGAASGGDVNLTGSAGVASGATASAGSGTGGGTGGVSAGGGAPANLPYRGGAGGISSASNADGRSPGGGAGISATQGAGDGAIIAVFIQDVQ